jgi:hypothetical protein
MSCAFCNVSSFFHSDQKYLNLSNLCINRLQKTILLDRLCVRYMCFYMCMVYKRIHHVTFDIAFQYLRL